MTKTTTIYLATITEPKDYSADNILDTKVFDSLDKAETFMTESGLRKTTWGNWEMENSDIFGDIMTLKVN